MSLNKSQTLFSSEAVTRTLILKAEFSFLPLFLLSSLLAFLLDTHTLHMHMYTYDTHAHVFIDNLRWLGPALNSLHR